MRIGWEVGSLRICSLLHASSEMGREKKQQYNIGSTSHQSSRQAWPRICNSSKHFIFVFSTQVSCFNLSLKLSFNLSDFMFFFSKTLYWSLCPQATPSRFPRHCTYKLHFRNSYSSIFDACLPVLREGNYLP